MFVAIEEDVVIVLSHQGQKVVKNGAVIRVPEAEHHMMHDRGAPNQLLILFLRFHNIL